MKKSLLVLLLVAVLVSPAFAKKGDMSVNAKLGLGADTSVTITNPGTEASMDVSLNPDMPFIIGAEFFYGTSDLFFVGLGANYVFDSSQNIGAVKVEGGVTNVYVALRPEFKVESDIVSSVYLLGHVGLSFGRSKASAGPETTKMTIDSGIYLGAGFGATIKDAFFAELLFSASNGTLHMDFDTKAETDIRYSITSLNIGYRFKI